VDLPVEVCPKLVAVYDASVLFLQLLAIESYEEGAHVVEELVDPGQMHEGLVDSLPMNQCNAQNAVCKGLRTTNMSPTSFAAVHFSVYPSFLYVGFSPASDWGTIFSSMKTSRMRLLMMCAPTGTYVRDQRTTPEVVRTSKVSSMAGEIKLIVVVDSDGRACDAE
jgi:hypothetical protein